MELNQSEKADLRIILEAFYGASTVASWEMNERVLEATARLLNASKECSTAVGFMPRPNESLSRYLRRQLREIARGVKSGARYEICNSAVKWAFKSEINIAAQGL